MTPPTSPSRRRSRRKPAAATMTALAALTSTALAVGVGTVPAAQADPAPAAPASGRLLSGLGDTPVGLSDVDQRGTALPTRTQRTAAAALGAVVRWNSFGTPSSILPADGSLGATTSRNPVTAARSWLAAHRSVLGLSAAQVGSLELVNNQHLAQSPARAVLFRQRFGDLTPALGSMVTVGVADGQIAYVSSSLAKTSATPPKATLTPTQGWLAAAASVGRTVPLAKITDTLASAGWTRLTVTGFAQQQQVRLRALALADGVVRPVFEANVVDVAGGSAFAYTVMVDAVTGRVLHRQNQVEQSSDALPLQGTVTATACGPKHPFEVTDDKTRQIVVAATAAVPTNDLVVKLFAPGGELLGSGDLLTSPETFTYSSDAIAPGVYAAQICPFDAPTVPFVAPGNYVGLVTTSDTETPQAAVPYPPKWSYFAANPTLDWATTHTPTNRSVGCWVTRYQGKRVPGCTLGSGALESLGSPGPWDFSTATGTPTFTTIGNNASTHEAWASPTSPGGLFQAPFAPDRSYDDAFTDAWNNSRCDPTNLVPGGNDINAATTNLFVSHNRMHDYAYYLGFTEANYNLQMDNLGRNPDPTRENDPEIGNVQAGGITGGVPTYLGRDNANQIALQDGVPGITNQFLFGPIAGSFYAPCTDGSLDMSIVGHEYTHAISNRMIGGPDEGITSEQGGAMGESWGDLTAGEYLFSHGYATGANPWAVGPYATGNKRVGIRDYAINHNPLNYGDYGFDSTGPEVHADGEIWNGTMWQVRQALVKKYDARFRYTDKALQLRCAQGTGTSSPLPSTRCPGNRRWIQLVFDAFLLQQGATSMLDARDAMLAADQMRYHGANHKELWLAFARRGMGQDASTPSADSDQPHPGFVAPGTRSGTVRFVARDHRRAVAGTVYLGRYEARVSPVADTIRKTELGASLTLAPGRYDVLFRAPGRGLTRSHVVVRPGKRITHLIEAPENLASRSNGAVAIASSPGSINADQLIDDTEATSWAGINDPSGDAANVDETHPFVVVDLAGMNPHTIHSVRVSAMLHPGDPQATDAVPLATDPDAGSRFTALRRFAIDACLSHCLDADASWKRVFVSGANAFPGARPRPVAPDLSLRSFDVPDTRARFVRLVALENQCTGYAGYAGEQDADPTNATDCKTASDRGTQVRAAELEVF